MPHLRQSDAGRQGVLLPVRGLRGGVLVPRRAHRLDQPFQRAGGEEGRVTGRRTSARRARLFKRPPQCYFAYFAMKYD